MSHELSQTEDVDPWGKLSNWEQQCVDEFEKTPDIEVGFQREKDQYAQKIWIMFQNAATGIAQLYKDRQQGVSLWVPFQNAASSVTTLYKESSESPKQFFDMGLHCGNQRRNKELLSWAKKRKRHIRREELIAYLSGRSPPPQRHWTGPRPRLSLDGMRAMSHLSHSHRFPSVEASELRSVGNEEPNFEIFNEALGFTPALRQHNMGSPNGNFSRMHRTRPSSSHNELGAFIAEEFSRHARKRSPTNDVIMDSPTHKRSRLNSQFF